MSRAATLGLAVVLAAALCVGAVLSGLVTLNVGDNAKRAYANKGTLEVICEVEASKPTEGLIPPFETSKLTLPAIFNFEENTGAYAGEYTISMNRKGTLKVNGELLELHRPAMFKRFGTVIMGEHVTLNRKTGAFHQWLDLDGDKRLDLINGTCKRTDNAPF